MGVFGKLPNQRRRVSTSSSAETAPIIADPDPAVDTAAYISEVCAELLLMARDAKLAFLSHLLAMAQAEAEHYAELGRSNGKSRSS